ncbi:MAG: NAD-dependent epimerase/dehydratase family protein [bacterium]|nr:NAD-dependent epimerase/dehydratase family protein [bacterium]
MHILITGGAGFIGSHLVEYHLNKGDSVLAVDNLSTGSASNLEPFFGNRNLRFEEADILTWPHIQKMVDWADCIYHMAAVEGRFKILKEPIKVLSVNVAGTERLLRAVHASKWNPVVLIGSSADVYGNRVGPKKKSNPDDEYDTRGCPSKILPCDIGKKLKERVELSEDMEPLISSNMDSRSTYSVSKLADELFAISYARQYDLNVRVVRFFNVVGPRQSGESGTVVPRFVEQALKCEPITIFGDGTQTRCFVDVRDAVKALDLLCQCSESKGEVVNLGSRHEVTVRQLAEMIQGEAPGEVPITYILYNAIYGAGYKDVQHRLPSLKKLKSLIPFELTWTLKDTIKDIVKWTNVPRDDVFELEGHYCEEVTRPGNLRTH